MFPIALAGNHFSSQPVRATTSFPRRANLICDVRKSKASIGVGVNKKVSRFFEPLEVVKPV